MAQDAQAFALKESTGELNGCTVAKRDGSTIDVAARLKNGNGTIVVTDPQEIEALQGVDSLKAVTVPDAPAKSKAGER